MAKIFWRIVFLSLIVFLALFLKIYHLDKVPPSLFSDEVDLGYQAYSFLKTGKDYFGNRWPISFHSFADFRAPFYIYSAAGTIAAFGMNEWGVRLPAAIFGIFGIIAFFFLIKEITDNISFSLLATFFLTITPWHFHYSRAGFEATAIFFLVTFGLWLFFRSLRKNSFGNFISSLFVLSLGFYTYATARLFLPLLGAATFLIFRKKILNFGWKKLIIAFLLTVVILLPFLKDSVFGGGLHRFSYLSIFSDSNLKYEVDRQRLVDAVHGREQTVGMKTPFEAFVFHNKPISWAWTIINNYFSSFSTSFLFLKGDPNLRHGVGNFGVILVFMAPFLIIGVTKTFWLVKEEKKGILSSKQALFWLFFLFLAPIPSSITYDGGFHATRLFLMVLPLVVLITIGFWEFLSWLAGRKIKYLAGFVVFTLLCLNCIFYFHQYFYHYPIESERYWHFGFKQGISRLAEVEKDYDKVIISSSYEPPLLFFLFWSKFSPLVFNIHDLVQVSEDWFDSQRLDKYYFGKIGSSFLDTYLPLQVKKGSMEKILILAGRNDFGTDLEKASPTYLRIIDKIYLPSREPVLYLLRTKNSF